MAYAAKPKPKPKHNRLAGTTVLQYCMSTPPPPLTAEDYWTADQLQVMRGLELPAWFSPVARRIEPAVQASEAISRRESAAESLPESPSPPTALAMQAVTFETELEAQVEAKIQDLSALDAPGLALAASQCQACALGQASGVCRKPLLLDSAQSKAHWLIVVDDSNQASDQNPELLSEAAQRLLGNMLASVGQSLATASVTSLLKCGRASDAVLDAYSDEVQACQPILQQQLALLKPSLIIAMGELAAQALVGVDDELSSLVGEIHEYEGLPLLAMPHPEALLREPTLKAQVWRDLNLIS